MPQFSVGDTLQGQLDSYEITDLISDKGGYGVTYKVRDSAGQVKVAKVRREASDKQFSTPQEFKVCESTFEVEYQALASFNHPQIPKAYEIFDHQGMRVMIVGFVDGRDLKDIVDGRAASGNPVTVDEAVDWIIDLLGVLEYVHGKNITHRDQKPENVMINVAGRVVILDFGSSTKPRMGQLRRTTSVAITLGYSSPQVLEGTSPSEPRDDIFSAGMMLEELITGITPAPVSNPDGGTIHIPGQQPIATPKLNPGDIVARNPQCPQALEDIIFKARRFERVDRYQTAAEMRQALEQLISGAPEIRLSDGGQPVNAHDFGQVLVRGSKRWDFDIENIGSKPLNITKLIVSQGFAAGCSTTTIGPGGKVVVVAEFNPQQAGALQEPLQIESDDPNNQTVTVQLQGEGIAPEIEVDPTSIDFGQVELGQEAKRTVKIRNLGKAPLDITDIAAPNDFAVNTTDPLPFTLDPVGGPDDECEVEIVFTPQVVRKGPGQITITSNDQANPAVVVDFQAESTKPQPPQLTHVAPSNAEQGTTGQKLVLYGNNFPLLEQFVVVDFDHHGITVTNTEILSHTNIEVTIDVAKNAKPEVCDVIVLNQLGGVPPATLQKAFTVTAAKVTPVVISMKPNEFYPGDTKQVTFSGTGFAKTRKPYQETVYDQGEKQRRERKEEKYDVHTSIFSTNATDVVIRDVEILSPISAKATVEVLKTALADDYDITATNPGPDNEQGTGDGLLTIKKLEDPDTGEEMVRCIYPDCGKLIPAFDPDSTDKEERKKRRCKFCKKNQMRRIGLPTAVPTATN